MTDGQVGGIQLYAQPSPPLDGLVGEKLAGLVERKAATALVAQLDAVAIALAAGEFNPRRRACGGGSGYSCQAYQQKQNL